MTYASGGLIQAADYNGFSTSVNSVWSTGAANSGYGQTALGSVSAGSAPTSLVRATEWSSLFSTISTSAAHQGTTITGVTTPAAGGIITAFVPTVANNITAITNGRLNAVAQGSTASNTKTNTAAWGGTSAAYTLTMTATAQFASLDAVRYFFNAGGQLRVTLSHPTGGQGTGQINGYLSALCADCGTLVLSSPAGAATATIAGTAYRGTTKIGGAGTSTVANTIGFYGLTSSLQTLLTQNNTAYVDYGSSSILVRASYSSLARTISYSILFTVTDADLVGTNPPPTNGTQFTLTAAYPSTTYLANSWGTVTLA